MRKVIAEAAALSNESFRKSWSLQIPAGAAGIAGGAVGAGIGKATLVVGAAAGTKGAAALASGLAFAGGAVGGGMAAGIAVVAAPVAIVGAGAYAFAKYKGNLKLAKEKQELLQEALRRLADIAQRKEAWVSENEALRESIGGIEPRLKEAILNLRQDLGLMS